MLQSEQKQQQKIMTQAKVAIKQLSLKLTKDPNRKQQDQIQLAQILIRILDYPFINKAKRHKKANMIGNYDLYKEQNLLVEKFKGFNQNNGQKMINNDNNLNNINQGESNQKIYTNVYNNNININNNHHKYNKDILRDTWNNNNNNSNNNNSSNNNNNNNNNNNSTLKPNSTPTPIRQTPSISSLQTGLQTMICQCCGKIVNQDQLSYCTSLQDINLGIGTRLYFNAILYEILIYVIITVIFSIHSLVSNYDSCLQIPSGTEEMCRIQGISLNDRITNAQLHKDSLRISSILGLVSVIIWGVFNIIKSVKQRRVKNQMRESFIQASSFTIMLLNVPEQMLKNTLQQTHDFIQQIFYQYKKQLNSQLDYKIAKINIANNLYIQSEFTKKRHIQSLKQKFRQKQKTFKDWIIERKYFEKFSTVYRERQRLYTEYQQFMINQYQMEKMFKSEKNLGEIVKNEENEIMNKNKGESIDVNENGNNNGNEQDLIVKNRKSQKCSKKSNLIFVTFESSAAREQIVRQNLPITLLNFYQLCRRIPFPIKQIKIRSAPPPQQIIWQNIGFPQTNRIYRKIIVYSISFLLICASLGMTYGLNQAITTSSQFWLSIMISLVITIINFILEYIIMLLGRYPLQITQTNIQVNIAFTVGLFELLNVIGVPLGGLYITKRNLYGENGLSNDIFFIGVFNVFVPVVRMIDPYFRWLNVRNRWWENSWRRLLKFNGQKDFNKIYEDNYFDLGYQYAYIIKTAFFTSFFLPLQPILAIFALFGLILLYLINKYRVLYRFTKPKFNSSAVNSLINYILLCSPVVFAVGMLIFTNWQFYNTMINQYLNWAILIVSGGFFLFPFRLMYKFLKEKQRPEWSFKEKKAILPSEYDRMNPITKQQAIGQHTEYLSKLNKDELIRISLQNKIVHNNNNKNATNISTIISQNHTIPDPLLNNFAFVMKQMQKKALLKSSLKNNNPDLSVLKKSVLRQQIRQSRIKLEYEDGPEYNENLGTYVDIVNGIKSDNKVDL